MIQNFIPNSVYELLVAPQISPFEFGEDPINSGDLASLQCSVHKGDLPLNISWFHNSKLIQSGDNGIFISQVGKKVSSLTIEDVQHDHMGNYSCVAQNKAGLSSFTTQLFVNGTIYDLA